MKYQLASDTWDQQELKAIMEVMRDGRYTMGPRVAEFEKAFAKAFGVEEAVMVNSGSSANLLMIANLVLNDSYDLNPGDEVIVPAVSWSTTYFPLTQYGLKAVFVDIDLETLNIDPAKVEAAITPKTKAIFAVNLLGNSCDYEKLLMIANEHNLILIEDNCESLGGKYYNSLLGTIGHMGSFSFFFSHHMQTMEGGMILAHNTKDAQYLRSLRAHGWTRELPQENFVHNKTGNPFEDSFRFVLPGYCVRPLEMSGAVGLVQLDKMPLMIEKRRANAIEFNAAFAGIDDVLIQKEVGNGSSWFGFSIVLRGKLEGNRSQVLALLSEAGVETRPIVAGNFTKNPVIKYIPHEIRGSLDNADYIDKNGFFIGNDSRDLSNEIVQVGDLIRKCLNG
jgi:CDP-4-dehydro-6-deoxyglucose reductase, E1